jgi:hypothetical protein
MKRRRAVYARILAAANTATGFITKAANHTISGAQPLDLHHCPLARLIHIVQPFRDDTVCRSVTRVIEPAPRLVEGASTWRKHELVVLPDCFHERFQHAPPDRQR